MSDTAFLPYGRQSIDEDDIAAVTAALRGELLTTGPTVEKFEHALAAAVGAADAVVVNSGTAALHIACMAAGLGPGTAAIVPAITFLATANAVRMTGAEVVFADVDADTGLMELSHAEAALARGRAMGLQVRAILPVHLSGILPDLVALQRFADTNGLTVIEDACHALGSQYDTRVLKGLPVGACAHSSMTCFSFHPVKTVAMGEGGAVTLGDRRLAQTLRQLRNHGMTRETGCFSNARLAWAADGRANPWYYEAHDIMPNYRASDIACALGLSQLNKLPRFAQRRQELSALYDRMLAPLSRVVRRPPTRADQTPVRHLYPVAIDFHSLGLTRAAAMEWLKGRGIGTQVHYIPVPWQPVYTARYGHQPFPGASVWYEHTLSLPLYADMTDDDVMHVVNALTELAAPVLGSVTARYA